MIVTTYTQAWRFERRLYGLSDGKALPLVGSASYRSLGIVAAGTVLWVLPVGLLTFALLGLPVLPALLLTFGPIPVIVKVGKKPIRDGLTR